MRSGSWSRRSKDKEDAEKYVALVSIPLRYMHNPDEVGSLQDVSQCIDLLAEFFARCTEDMNLRPF